MSHGSASLVTPTNQQSSSSTTPAEAGTPGSQNPKEIQQTVETLLERVLDRSPMFKLLVDAHRNSSLFDFAATLFSRRIPGTFQTRRDEFLDIVRPLVEQRVPQHAENVLAQLRSTNLVSTTDHHAFIQHPYWLNSNIITALSYQGQPAAMNAIIVFSFASVSLNNSSGFPRGVMFHGQNNGRGQLLRLPLFLDKEKMGTVYGTRPFTQADIDRALETLRTYEKEGTLSAERAKGVAEILRTEYGTPEMLACANLCEQTSLFNVRMWPKLFRGSTDMPELVYLDIETIVTELLVSSHLHDPQSPVHTILFTEAGRERAARLFKGITGMFTDTTGSYYFWGLNAKLNRVPLRYADGFLSSADGDIRVAMTPDAIAEALRSKKIMPGMGLCYLLIALHYGFTCLGGFCQIQDLTFLKRAWQAFLRETGNAEEAGCCDCIETMGMSAGGMSLAYHAQDDGTLVPATGIDMLLEPAMDTSFSRYVSLAKNVGFVESMYALLPDSYKVFYPQPDRDQSLLRFSAEEITRATGLGRKFLSPTV